MTTALSPYAAFSAPQVHGLNAVTQDALNGMFAQWVAKMPRNIERLVYADGKNKLKDLKVSLPPHLVDVLDIVMGWPEKAVFELSNRIVLERVASASGEADPFELQRLLHENRFKVEFRQAIASSLSHSVAFGSTTPGDASAGEPEVLLMFHSALWSTGLWDRRRRALSSGLLINDTDSLGHPTQFTILNPFESIVCVKGAGGWYVDDVVSHNLGRVPFEPLPFRPTLDRPFGRSRIDRRVMSLTDRAVRAGARLEVHSELFSAMKLILLGADEDAFVDQAGNKVPLWSFYMGRVNMLSKDEDGDLPELEKITAESPEPHIAVMRQLASEFSGHTGVPLGSLGIATDNPESQGAKQEARQDVVADAESQHDVYGIGLLRMLENAVMLRDNLSSPPDGILDLALKWRRPDRATLSALADAGSKQVAAVPGLAETRVGMELLGMDPDQIDEAQSELRRAQGAGALGALLADREATARDAGPTAVEDATAMKARFDALGIAIRAGVDPAEAARRLGLDGITFTGATPVSLRLPERDAADLEDR